MADGSLQPMVVLRCRRDTQGTVCWRKDTYNHSKPKLYLPPTAHKRFYFLLFVTNQLHFESPSKSEYLQTKYVILMWFWPCIVV